MTAVLERPPLTVAAFDAYDARRFPPDVEQTPEPELPAYIDDPVGYCRDILWREPWSKQAEVLRAIPGNRRVAVRSGHGVGKTSLAAWAAIWFLHTRPGKTRVITTGTSWNSVRTLLWTELKAAHRRVARTLGGTMTETALRITDERFAIGLSTDKPERFAGQHADHLLLIVDEASGVAEEIFEVALGYMTGDDAHMLLIGNPTQLAGEFYAAFHSKRNDYATFRISALETPAFTGEPVSAAAEKSLGGIRTYVADAQRLYGEDSPVYDVRVLGDFPSVTDDTVVPLAQLEAAKERELVPRPPVVVACDVARFGSDETVIAVRHGCKVRIAKTFGNRDLMSVVGEILRVARAEAARFEELDPPILVVDDVGLGGGVTDRLRELAEFDVMAFNGGAEALDPLDYPNRRSEAWFAFAEQLPLIDLDEDEQLAADLLAPRYKLDSRCRRVVEPKADTKKRLRRSPDRADAVLMAFTVRGRIPRTVEELLGQGCETLTGDLLERPL